MPKSTREQIVDSAAELIWQRGYSRASVDDIIRGAGVCKGSFYHHFTSKEDVAVAVIDVWTTHFGAHISANLADDRSPEENLHAILDGMVTAQEQSGFLGCPLGRLALEMGDVSEVLQSRLREGFEKLASLFTSYFRQAGLAKSEAAAQGRCMLATLEGSLMLEKVHGGGDVLHGLIATMKADLSRRLPARAG